MGYRFEARSSVEIPPRDFAGRGTARSAVEGFFGVGKGPSTMLRMVPFPCKRRGGFLETEPS